MGKNIITYIIYTGLEICILLVSFNIQSLNTTVEGSFVQAGLRTNPQFAIRLGRAKNC